MIYGDGLDNSLDIGDINVVKARFSIWRQHESMRLFGGRISLVLSGIENIVEAAEGTLDVRDSISNISKISQNRCVPIPYRKVWSSLLEPLLQGFR